MQSVCQKVPSLRSLKTAKMEMSPWACPVLASSFNHLMVGTVGSTRCTGCPDLVLQLSCFFFILCSQHLLSLHKYFTGTSCSSLAEQESRGWLSAILVFPDSAGFSLCPPERLEFSSSLFKLCLHLWWGFRGRSSLKHVTGAWCRIPDAPLSICLLLTR